MKPEVFHRPSGDFDQVIVVRHPDRVDVTVTADGDAYYVGGERAAAVARAVRDAVFGRDPEDHRCLIP